MFRRIAMLALLCVSLACAKTYHFSIFNATQAGNVQLKPGEYSVKVDGPQVVVLDPSGNRIDVEATLQEGDRKFDHTMVLISRADGANRIVSVELGGSKISVVFQ